MGRYIRSLPWAIDQFLNRIRQDIDFHFNTSFSKPSRIIFCLTLRCNIRCRQCGIWKTTGKKELSTDEWKKVILELRDWLGPFRLQIAGGEIFLRKDVVELVRLASRNGVLIGMVSNGTLIDKAMADALVDAGLSYFDISIDGIRRETHDFIRGVDGVFDKAMSTVRYLQESSRAAGSPLSITVATVVMGINMNELVPLVRWVEEQNLNGIIFNPLGPACDSNPHWYLQNELWCPPEKLDRLDATLDELVALKRAGARILNSEDQFLEMKAYFRNPDKVRGTNCRVGVTNFLVSCEGEIHMCFRTPPVGDISQSPREVWTSRKARQTRSSIRNCADLCSPGNFVYRRSILKEIQRYLRYS